MFCNSILILSAFWTLNNARQYNIYQPTALTSPCGKVQGVKENNAFVFKGIPYAKPPVKELRWVLPQSLSKKDGSCWKGIFHANKYGNKCFQESFLNNSGNEDCLYLNVYTPTLDKMAKLPVMVWIHGGSLMIGYSDMENYTPTAELAHKANMVFVGMNYRLNGFGFMTLDLLSERADNKKSGNYGFADQIKALEWVKDNINNFGGDPNKVTIFGQSSGGTSVYALLTSPKAKGLFHRAWAQSASPILNKTMEDASKDNLVFLDNTGCKNIYCLLNLSPKEVFDALPIKVYPSWGMEGMNEIPNKGVFIGALAVVDGDIIPKPIFEAWENGEGNDVPTLISTTGQEVDAFPDPTISTWNWKTYKERVAKHLNTFGKHITKQALRLYPPLKYSTPEYQYTSMVSDVRVNCLQKNLAIKMSSTYESPIYKFVITSFPSVRTSLLGLPFKAAYAFHGWDSYAFFGVIPKVIKNFTESDLQFQKIIQENVFHFVKTGTVKKKTWLPFPEMTALISDQIQFVSDYHEDECEFWLSHGFGSYSWIN